jgi:membrane-associated phospholipid phosphatase
MKKIIKAAPEFFILYIIFLIISITLLSIYGKAAVEIWCNSHNSPFLDRFFAVFTNVGDGLFAAILSIFLLFCKTGYGIMLAVTNIFAGLFAQILKRLVFYDVVRPKVYFSGIYDLHFVDGVKVLSAHSMPSGHTATAFAVFLCLAIFVKNSFVRVLFFFMAVLVGYSRIYLSQHFLTDVTVGSIVGVMVVMVYYHFHTKIEKAWYHKPFLTLFRK